MGMKSDRRGFLKTTLAASAGAALVGSYEERALLAYATERDAGRPAPVEAKAGVPMAKFGDVVISRLICGGNLVSGYAHSRDLIYVSDLLRHYFTDEKIIETLRLCEENGINTAMLKLDDNTLRVVGKYWHEAKGGIQWIAQIVDPNALKEDVQKAADAGAIGVFTTGQMGDSLVRQNRVDLIAATVECAKDRGLLAGVSCHELAAIRACEAAKAGADFYMKTFNSKNYWSASGKGKCDNVFNDEPPQETIATMQNLDKPWVAFKVLGAGAVPPKEGFDYAFRNGADFVCVGMFDFQVAEDAALAREAIAQTQDRRRPWHG